MKAGAKFHIRENKRDVDSILESWYKVGKTDGRALKGLCHEMVWAFFSHRWSSYSPHRNCSIALGYREKMALECIILLAYYNIGKCLRKKLLAKFHNFVCRNSRIMRLGKGLFSHKQCMQNLLWKPNILSVQ